ncbi:MAG TPA: c-type cytochrome [Steroidobacteraceae bacterium]|nr:c-type cytochrome [Steroidobacteraceae bacterium]
MTPKFVAALGLVTILGWSGIATAAGNKEAGQAKSATCMACHGMDGNSANPEWPSLAGQHASYITKQLKHFKANERSNPLMSPMAMMLGDQDVEDLAVYYASTTTRPTGEAEPSKVKLGERLYRAGNPAKGVPACAGCHGPTGAGNPGAAYPRIGGQHAVYAAAQLRAYKSGARATDPNSMMRAITTKLSEDEIDAVASYLQGLR